MSAKRKTPVAEAPKRGRPPVDDPWVNMTVRLRGSDRDALRAKVADGEPSAVVRSLILDYVQRSPNLKKPARPAEGDAGE